MQHKLTMDMLRSIVEEAYGRGMCGCAELKKQDIEDIVNAHKKVCCDSGFRIWKVDELSRLPNGTLFQHLTMGRCYLATRANGKRYAQFAEGHMMPLVSDTHPWDKPMQMLHTS